MVLDKVWSGGRERPPRLRTAFDFPRASENDGLADGAGLAAGQFALFVL